MKTYSGIIKCLALLVIVPIVLWSLSLGKTYDLYHRNMRVEAMGRGLESGEVQGKPVTAPRQSEAFLSTGKILDTVALYAAGQKVAITRYTPCLTGSEGELSLYTGTLVLSGGYTGLVRVMDFIEHSPLPVKVISAGFRTQKQPKDKSESLFLTLILQQLETASV